MKEIVATSGAPQAIGPYSQAVRAGNLVFASGQIPIDPATGEFVVGGVAEQTEQVLRNLAAVFEAAGVGLNQVVKTTVFLVDMEDRRLNNLIQSDSRGFKHGSQIAQHLFSLLGDSTNNEFT